MEAAEGRPFLPLALLAGLTVCVHHEAASVCVKLRGPAKP